MKLRSPCLGSKWLFWLSHPAGQAEQVHLEVCIQMKAGQDLGFSPEKQITCHTTSIVRQSSSIPSYAHTCTHTHEFCPFPYVWRVHISQGGQPPYIPMMHTSRSATLSSPTTHHLRCINTPFLYLSHVHTCAAIHKAMSNTQHKL